MIDSESPGGLVDALMSGDVDYLVDSLRKIPQVDGEPLELMAGLLDSDPSLKGSCEKRLGFSSWTRKKRSISAQQGLPTIPDILREALASADNFALAAAVRHFKALEGNSLEVVRRLLEGDERLKPYFPKRLRFAGWGRGRPATESTFKRAERANLCRVIERRTKRGDQLKAVIADLMDETELSRSYLMEMWGSWKRK